MGVSQKITLQQEVASINNECTAAISETSATAAEQKVKAHLEWAVPTFEVFDRDRVGAWEVTVVCDCQLKPVEGGGAIILVNV